MFILDNLVHFAPQSYVPGSWLVRLCIVFSLGLAHPWIYQFVYWWLVHVIIQNMIFYHAVNFSSSCFAPVCIVALKHNLNPHSVVVFFETLGMEEGVKELYFSYGQGITYAFYQFEALFFCIFYIFTDHMYILILYFAKPHSYAWVHFCIIFEEVLWRYLFYRLSSASISYLQTNMIFMPHFYFQQNHLWCASYLGSSIVDGIINRQRCPRCRNQI